MNAAKNNLIGIGLQILSEGIHMNEEPVKMQIVKEPISAKKCNWEVTESYCAKKGKKIFRSYDVIIPSKLEFVRKLPTIGTMQRTQLTVNVNGVESVYTLGKKNEYFLNGVSLTQTLETLAKCSGNKISIR